MKTSILILILFLISCSGLDKTDRKIASNETYTCKTEFSSFNSEESKDRIKSVRSQHNFSVNKEVEVVANRIARGTLMKNNLGEIEIVFDRPGTPFTMFFNPHSDESTENNMGVAIILARKNGKSISNMLAQIHIPDLIDNFSIYVDRKAILDKQVTKWSILPFNKNLHDFLDGKINIKKEKFISDLSTWFKNEYKNDLSNNFVDSVGKGFTVHCKKNN